MSHRFDWPKPDLPEPEPLTSDQWQEHLRAPGGPVCAMCGEDISLCLVGDIEHDCTTKQNWLTTGR